MRTAVEKPGEQIYSNYTEEDFAVWKLLYEKQMHNLQGKVVDEFNRGIEGLNFNPDEIPNFEKVNEKLLALTGWSIKTVPNLAEVDLFFEQLSKRRFTSTCWLRSLEEFDYLEEPDMFHDVFAHVPMLCDEKYTHFFHKIGQLATNLRNKESIKMLQRLYWYTIEFGVLQNKGDLKIYGAGIISSVGEINNVYGGLAQIKPFNIEEVLYTPFEIDKVQPLYFSITSFDELVETFEQIVRFLPSC
jgi:phenylalanine-4-hydroxylase